MTNTHEPSNYLLIPEESFKWMRHAVCTLVHERRIAGRGVPPGWTTLYRDFMSDNGHKFRELQTRTGQLDEDDDLIGSTEAALLLGWTPRTVLRHRTELGGVRPAGRHWLFSRRSVVACIERRDRHA